MAGTKEPAKKTKKPASKYAMEPILIGPCQHGVVGGCKRDDGPPCKTCRGYGFIGRIKSTYYGDYPDSDKCPDCQGTGTR